MLLYAAVGDSLTVGTGAWPGAGLVPQYCTLASKAANQCVATVNLGMSGATTKDILHLVKYHAKVRFLLARADIITITAGGNDLIDAAKKYARRQDPLVLQQALHEGHAHYAELVHAIRGLKANRSSRYIIRAADLYNPFPAIPSAAGAVQRFNRRIDSLQCGNFQIAPIYGLFAGREKELLSADGFHPNAQGYRVIAGQMGKLGYRPLF